MAVNWELVVLGRRGGGMHRVQACALVAAGRAVLRVAVNGRHMEVEWLVSRGLAVAGR